jgi:hypothetical protein
VAIRHRLALFSVFQNVASYLEEWIEFHRTVGVDHFYLYDNESTDHWRDVLSPYLHDGSVSVTDWPMHDTLEGIQIAALKRCIARVRSETRWLGFIDADEFLFPTREDTIVDVLERHYRWGSGVSVHWYNFGPSGHEYPPDGLVSESFTRRAERDSPLNQAVKSIYRPWSVYRLGGYAVHKPWCAPPTRVDEGHLQLNHYWTRSETELLQRCKDARGMVHLSRVRYGITGAPAGWEQKLLARVRDDYSIEDRSIERFLPELHQRLSSRAPGDGTPR